MRNFPWRFFGVFCIALGWGGWGWASYRLGVEHGKQESERALKIALGQLERDKKTFDRYVELLDQCRAAGWEPQPLEGVRR